MKNLLNYQIIITGVTGWIGSRLLHRLRALGLNYGTDVLGISSQVKSLEEGSTSFTFQTLDQALDSRPKLIFHFAFITKDKVNGLTEAEYIEKNHALRDAVANLIGANPIHAFVYASSGAVYKFLEKTNKPDLFLYGKLKHEDELFFEELAQKHHINYILPRIFNLSGAHINKIEHYALANFIQAAIDQKTITIKAPCHVLRSYVDIDTMLSLLLNLCLTGTVGKTTFDVSDEQAIELYELAKIIVNTLPLPPVAIEVKESRTGEDTYLGSYHQISQLLQRFNLMPISIEQQIMNTYHSLIGVEL